MQPTTHFCPPRKDERLSRPGWLTYSRRFTYISGHPSATGRAQDSESSPVRDRRSTTEPRNQPLSVTNIGTHLSEYLQLLSWWSIIQDISPEPRLDLLTLTHRQKTEALKTNTRIPVFAIAAGKQTVTLEVVNIMRIYGHAVNRACKLLKFVSMVSMFLTISGDKQNNCCNGA